jgi:prepilin-type N-terminal cleavage/methylation domain-containing protein
MQSRKTEAGFTLLEVMVAISLSVIVMLAVTTGIMQQSKALTHFQLRAEMLNLLVTASVQGSACKSVMAAGGVAPMAPCGSPGVPATIDVLDAGGGRVDTGSPYLLRAVCPLGMSYYTLELKHRNAAKVDPFNSQPIGAAFFATAVLRFAAQAFTGPCP